MFPLPSPLHHNKVYCAKRCSVCTQGGHFILTCLNLAIANSTHWLFYYMQSITYHAWLIRGQIWLTRIHQTVQSHVVINYSFPTHTHGINVKIYLVTTVSGVFAGKWELETNKENQIQTVKPFKMVVLTNSVGHEPLVQHTENPIILFAWGLLAHAYWNVTLSLLKLAHSIKPVPIHQYNIATILPKLLLCIWHIPTIQQCHI